MIGCRAARISHVLAVLGVVALLSGCGPQQPMQRLGGTLPPTVTPVPGLAAPTAPPGEPGAAQSEIDNPTTPLGVSVQPDGEWPDLLFANLYERPRDSEGVYRPDPCSCLSRPQCRRRLGLRDPAPQPRACGRIQRALLGGIRYGYGHAA
jgi:hypothetical protein